MTTDAALRAEVEQSIGQVMDPCSLAMGRPLDLVAMGLVERIDVVAGRVTVRLILTDPNCFLQTEIVRAVDEAVREVPGVAACDVSLSGEVLWTPDRITAPALRREQPAAG